MPKIVNSKKVVDMLLEKICLNEAETFGNSFYVKFIDITFQDGKVSGVIDTIGGEIPVNWRYDKESVRYEHIEGKRLVWLKNPKYRDDKEIDTEMYNKLKLPEYRKTIGFGMLVVVDAGYLEWYNSRYGRLIIRGNFRIRNIK